MIADGEDSSQEVGFALKKTRKATDVGGWGGVQGHGESEEDKEGSPDEASGTERAQSLRRERAWEEEDKLWDEKEKR